MFASSSAWAQPADSTYLFSHFAGAAGGPGAVDGTGSAARFNTPDGIATDNQGNNYVVDSVNHTIRKVTSTGVVTTLAGLAGTPGNTDGTGSAARFSDPHGIAVDSGGNIYVADSGNATIRKITSGGVVTTFAGRGAPGSADGTGTAAEFWYPRAIAIDRAGTFYVMDNSTVRKITPGGVVTTFAGTAGPWGYVDGSASVAKFFNACGIAVNSAGTVYVADSSNNRIRKITPDGTVSTLKDDMGQPIYLTMVHGIAVDSADTLYVTSQYYRSISKITLAGELSTLAGPISYVTAYAGDNDGTGTDARFNIPFGIAVDNSGTCYVADSRNHTVRKISPIGVVTTLAGASNGPGTADGTGGFARFNTPNGLAADTAGNIYVADSANYEIRKITPTGTVTTVAGVAGYLDYYYTPMDGTGSAARFYYPSGIAVDPLGTLYVADTGNNSIRKITPGGVVTTIASISGPAYGGYADGQGAMARFRAPRGIALDTSGTLYVTDVANRVIRKITPDGMVSTFAGTAGQIGSADGTGSTAQFAYPSGIAVDKNGTLYVTDIGSFTIRKITPGGVVTTFAGTAGVSGTADGTGSAAQFRNPISVTIDSSGNLYVTESPGYYAQPNYGNTVRKITPSGVVTTIAGSSTIFGSDDGLGFAAKFNGPSGITLDSANNLYIADAGNNSIRKGILAGPPVIATQPLSQSVPLGGSVQFSVTASAVPAPTYQWFFNGTAFSGATTNTLSFTSARATDAGDYTVVITNALGSVTSNKATLTVSTTTTPSPGGGSGGGGSIEHWFALTLTFLYAARCVTSSNSGLNSSRK